MTSHRVWLLTEYDFSLSLTSHWIWLLTEYDFSPSMTSHRVWLLTEYDFSPDCITWVTRRVPIVGNNCSLLSSTCVHSRMLVEFELLNLCLCCVLSIIVIFLSFFIWPLNCLFLELRILITHNLQIYDYYILNSCNMKTSYVTRTFGQSIVSNVYTNLHFVVSWPRFESRIVDKVKKQNYGKQLINS